MRHPRTCRPLFPAFLLLSVSSALAADGTANFTYQIGANVPPPQYFNLTSSNPAVEVSGLTVHTSGQSWIRPVRGRSPATSLLPPKPRISASTSAPAKTSRLPTSASPARDAALYAFVMGWPDREAVVPTLALGGKHEVGKIRSVALLGLRGNLKFTQDEHSLRVMLPPEKPSDHAICLKIVGA